MKLLEVTDIHIARGDALPWFQAIHWSKKNGRDLGLVYVYVYGVRYGYAYTDVGGSLLLARRGVVYSIIMSSAHVQCSIKGGPDGVNIVKSVEIRADNERGYLASLSSQLRQLQSDVNASLSELVDKEKSRGTNGRRKANGTYTVCGTDLLHTPNCAYAHSVHQARSSSLLCFPRRVQLGGLLAPKHNLLVLLKNLCDPR